MEKTRTGTIIGKTLILRGDLISDEELIIQGKVEGNIQQTKDLFIEEGGEIKANITVPSIQIAGRMLGNITATNKVEFLPGGVMVGDILAAPRVEITDGARFKGKIDMGDVLQDKSGSASTYSAPTPLAPTPSVSVPSEDTSAKKKPSGPGMYQAGK